MSRALRSAPRQQQGGAMSRALRSAPRQQQGGAMSRALRSAPRQQQGGAMSRALRSAPRQQQGGAMSRALRSAPRQQQGGAMSRALRSAPRQQQGGAMSRALRSAPRQQQGGAMSRALRSAPRQQQGGAMSRALRSAPRQQQGGAMSRALRSAPRQQQGGAMSRALWLAALLLPALLLPAAGQLLIGIAEESPVLAQQLAAAAEAAIASVMEDAASAAGEAGEAGDAGEAGGAPEPPGEWSVVTAPVEPGEPLSLAAQICELANAGVVVVITGAEEREARAGAAAAARCGVALLLAAAGAAGAAGEAGAALPLRPGGAARAELGAALLRAKAWRRAVLLHAAGAGAVPALAAEPPPALAARRLPPAPALLRDLLLVLKRAGETRFVVWGGAAQTRAALDAAQRVGLLDQRHSYLLLAPEMHTQPLEQYSHGGANITCLMIFDPASAEVQRAVSLWRTAYRARLGGDAGALRGGGAGALRGGGAGALRGGGAGALREGAAWFPGTLLLAYDGARAAVQAWGRLRPAGGRHADSLLNYLRSEQWSGSTGALSWAGGERGGAALRAAELARGGALQGAARWAAGALHWSRPPQTPRTPPRDAMENRTFVVLIAKNKPYIMRRDSTERLSGNDRYEGFCIELIERLAELLKFNYTFVEQVDGAYGSYNETTKKWNGMLQKLIEEDGYDLAITDLTITAERERAVDFTTPFMNLGISILYRKPKPPEPELFAFLLPFSGDVWLWLGVAYAGTSLVLYLAGRVCPAEWQNPHPCIEDPPALHNQFTLGNALWFNLGAMLLQGSEIAPVAYGTRAAASAWWLFALVITSSYTANLATLLAKKTSYEEIHDVDDLAYNDLGITYGAKIGGSTYTFFEHSESKIYQNMYQHMKEWKMPPTNEAGIERVMNEDEKFAFLMESTTIEYTIERNCAITMVGGLLDSKGYGIAMKKGSPYRQALNLALLNLQESGVLRNMKHTWWKEKHGGGACKEVDERSSTELSMGSFLGLWLVLLAGCGGGALLAAGDLMLRARRSRQQGTYAQRLYTELKFVFSFSRRVKPVHGPLFEPTPTVSQVSSERSEQLDIEAEEEEEAQMRARTGSGGTAGAGSGAGAGRRASARSRRSSIQASAARLARHARPSVVSHHSRH